MLLLEHNLVVIFASFKYGSSQRMGQQKLLQKIIIHAKRQAFVQTATIYYTTEWSRERGFHIKVTNGIIFILFGSFLSSV